MPKSVIYYCTGTGNSLWAARFLAEELGSTEVVFMDQAGSLNRGTKMIGLVFPVHMWGLPARVVQFVERLEPGMAAAFFAVAVNGGQVAATLVQLEKLMASRGLKLSAGFSLEMPSNYIPWGGPGPEAALQRTYARAQAKLLKAAAGLKAGEETPREKGPWWHNILYSRVIYPLSYPYIAQMDKKFWVDDKCDACRICEKICPTGNISLQAGKPAWQHRCEQCLACLQWCPREAIQYGPKTVKYPRYHHPEIKVQAMLAARRK